MAEQFWCQRGLVVVVDGPLERSTITVEKPFARIGSHPQCDVFLSDPEVPRRALYCHATDDGVYVVALWIPEEGSPQARGWVDSRQAITIGPYRIFVQPTGSIVTPLAAPALEAPEPLGDWQPLIAMGLNGQKTKTYRLSRRLTVVGRGKLSTLRIADGYVSTTHCVLYREGGRLWVIDLLSANGTKYEGEPIEVLELLPQQSVAIGNTTLTYAATGQSADTPAPATAASQMSVTPDSSIWSSSQPDYTALEDSELARAKAQWEAERQRLQSQLAELTEQLAQQSEQLRQERLRLEAELAELKQQQSQFQAEQQAAESYWRSQMAALEGLQSQLAAQQEELRCQQQQWQAEHARWEQELRERARQLEEKSARLAAWEETLLRQARQQSQSPPDQHPSLPAGPDAPAPATVAGGAEAAFGSHQAGACSAASAEQRRPQPQAVVKIDEQSALELEQLSQQITGRLIELQDSVWRRKMLKYLAAVAAGVGLLLVAIVIWQQGYVEQLLELLVPGRGER
jgi:pSer/pThr/pTyr-binding forkhead associated (FHA) protein